MRQLLRQAVTIYRKTQTQDSNLGVSSTSSAIYNIAASVQPASGSVMLFYAERQLKVTVSIFVAGTLDLQRGDTVTGGSETYVIVGWADLSGRERVTRIDCENYVP